MHRKTTVINKAGYTRHPYGGYLPHHMSGGYRQVLLQKLKRVLIYLNGTIGMPLTPHTNDLIMLKLWVDMSFKVHPSMRSRTSGFTLLCKKVM